MRVDLPLLTDQSLVEASLLVYRPVLVDNLLGHAINLELQVLNLAFVRHLISLICASGFGIKAETVGWQAYFLMVTVGYLLAWCKRKLTFF